MNKVERQVDREDCSDITVIDDESNKFRWTKFDRRFNRDEFTSENFGEFDRKYNEER